MKARKKIMFFTSRIPYPLEKGDKLRAYHQIKHLSKHSDIVLCCISSSPIQQRAQEELSKYTSAIHVYTTNKLSTLLNMFVAWLTGNPFQVGYFFNTGADLFFRQKIAEEEPDHIFVQLIRMAEYVLKEKKIPKSLDYMDTFSKGMERRWLKAKGIKKMIFKWEYKRLQKYEQKVFSLFNHTYIISGQDQAAFSFPEKEQIKVSVNGVDQAFFKPDPFAEKHYDIVFTGNMSYPPNINAALYIGRKIVPELVKDFPNLKVLIAGATPTNAVKVLENEYIHVSGWLDDIRDAYNEAKVFFAPLEIGTGLQNKLLEAMSMQLPCVTSKLANNALGAKDGVEVLEGEHQTEYLALLKSLLTNEILANSIAMSGKRFIIGKYDWNRVVDKLERDFFS